jgi:hypothetical protein
MDDGDIDNFGEETPEICRPVVKGASEGPVRDVREDLIQRFCKSTDEHFGSYGLLVGLFSHLQSDGYISGDQHEKLVEAVDEIRKPSRRMASVRESSPKTYSDLARASRRSSMMSTPAAGPSKPSPETFKNDAAAVLMLPCFGFKGPQGHIGPKERGNFEDTQETPCLPEGVDAKKVLHDRVFNCQAYGNIQDDSLVISFGFVQPVNYAGRYRIELGRLTAWLQAIGSQYTNQPYHNWRHAFDVFQLCFLMLTDGGMSAYFNYQDACSILIAAIAHDVGHAGTNNPFQLKARTQLAVMYNDQSPLENMHASRTFETMLKPGANFLEQLPREDFDNVRAKIVDAILATDPSHHFDFVKKFAARSEQVNTDPFLPCVNVSKDEKDKAANKQDRALLLQGIVHMADIGNAFRPWDVYKKLVVNLEAEFFMQGDQELALGLPITPMMNRANDSLACGQGFFLGKLVRPLFDLYAYFLDDELEDQFGQTLENNKDRWQELVESYGKKSAGELLSLPGQGTRELTESFAD